MAAYATLSLAVTRRLLPALVLALPLAATLPTRADGTADSAQTAPLTSDAPAQPAGLHAMPMPEMHDGMGHLPGHASPPEPTGDSVDPRGEHCDMMGGMMEHMDSDGSAERHHGHAGGHDGHEGHGMHGGMMAEHGARHQAMMDGVEDTLAAVSAPRPPIWLAGIELTESQQDLIFDILHDVAPAQRKAHRTAEKTHEQLHHIGLATDYSEVEARRLSESHAHAIGELSLLRAKTERRILDVLTPDQRRDAAHQAARED